MKVGIIGIVGLPASYGGFETLAEHLVDNLGDKIDFTVFCSSKRTKEKVINYKGAELKYLNMDANGIMSIPYDIISIIHAAKSMDSILILGVSGCIALPIIIGLFPRLKIVTNVDGIEWKRNKWNLLAKIFLRFSEFLAVKYSHVVIADNVGIQEYLTNTYNKRSELITYGGDHCKLDSNKLSNETNYPFLNKKYAFTVCRIEPENNIHIILEAFSNLTDDISLVIVGNWKASDYGRKLFNNYSPIPHIYLLDPIYDQDSLNFIRSKAYIYVHGHSAGGTNPSLVEAMWLGLPIIAFDVIYNRKTTFNEAIYFDSINSLETILKAPLEDIIGQISLSMNKIAVREYRWKFIAQKYYDLFLRIHNY